MIKNIQLYFFDLHDDKPCFQLDQGLLSESDQSRLQNISAEAKLQEFLNSRYLLHKVLQENFNLLLSEMQRQPDGRLSHEKNFFSFSMSHSQNRYAFAFAPADLQVGVDVESKFASKSAMSIAKQYFDKAEYDELSKVPENMKKTHFQQLWALKEALYKILGSLDELHKVVFSLNNAEALCDISHLNFKPFFFTRFTENFSLALCSMGAQQPKVDIYQFSGTQLTPLTAENNLLKQLISKELI